MKYYRVEVTRAALADMEKIYNYIANDLQAPLAAKKQYQEIADAALRLKIFPERNRCLESKNQDLRKLRRANVGKYSIFYLVADDRIVVTNVLYSASDIASRLRTDRKR